MKRHNHLQDDPSKLHAVQHAAPWSASLTGVVSVGCPACVPVIGAFLSSIGLGVFTNMWLLRPLATVLFIIGLWGFYANWQRHRKLLLFVGATVSLLTVFSARYVFESTVVMWIAFAMLVVMAVLDYRAAKSAHCTTCTLLPKIR
ncbi:MerC family mercury resistance protein [Candidatus Woesearchaeota archaeon]|nr:MerC family mercury resistance protein [Candidatus Woesearchaeota archaeon]